MHGIFFTGFGVANNMRNMTEQTAAIKQAANATATTRTELRDLRDQVERLAMLNQALWELLSERFHLTEEDLERKAQEVDLRDGKADGKMTAHPLRCPQCGRVSNSRHKKCLYCGMLFEGSVFG